MTDTGEDRRSGRSARGPPSPELGGTRGTPSMGGKPEAHPEPTDLESGPFKGAYRPDRKRSDRKHADREGGETDDAAGDR